MSDDVATIREALESLSDDPTRFRLKALNALSRLAAAQAEREELTFNALHTQNVSRAGRWHPGFPTSQDDWNGADWSNAMCGEAGEAANVVKKLRRLESGKRGRESETDAAALIQKLAAEIADVVIYADLLAAKYGIEVESAVVAKFNSVSEQYGFPEKLPVRAALAAVPEGEQTCSARRVHPMSSDFYLPCSLKAGHTGEHASEDAFRWSDDSKYAIRAAVPEGDDG